CFFFFQAEDGIRDLIVTGVQTCALPIWGCFWHQHKGCIDSHVPKSRQQYWRPKLKLNCKRDKNNERKLRAEGWAVLTLWECEVNDIENLRKQLTAFFQRH